MIAAHQPQTTGVPAPAPDVVRGNAGEDRLSPTHQFALGSFLASAGRVAAGLGFAGLGASAALAVPRLPEAGAAPATVIAYIQANQRALEWTWFLAGELAWLPGLLFCSALAVCLWRLGASSVALMVGLSGAITSASLTLAFGVPWGILIYLAPQLGPGQLVLVLAETRHFGDAAVSFPLAAMFLGFGAATLRLRSIGWRAGTAVAIVGAALQLAHSAVDFAASGRTGALLTSAELAVPAWAIIMSLDMAMPRMWMAAEPSRSSGPGSMHLSLTRGRRA